MQGLMIKEHKVLESCQIYVYKSVGPIESEQVFFSLMRAELVSKESLRGKQESIKFYLIHLVPPRCMKNTQKNP